MTEIDNLSDDADQLLRVALPDGSLALVEMVYQPTTGHWLMNVTYPAPPVGQAPAAGSFVLEGLTLVLGPNVLRDWLNVIPFGIGVVSNAGDGVDPAYIEDFLGGRISVFLLDHDDALNVEQTVYGNEALV